MDARRAWLPLHTHAHGFLFNINSKGLEFIYSFMGTGKLSCSAVPNSRVHGSFYADLKINFDHNTPFLSTSLWREDKLNLGC